MEKKLLRFIGAGLGIIIILTATLIIVNNKTEKYDIGAKVFADKEATDILKLDISNEYGSYSIYYDPDEEGYVFDDIPVNIVDFDGFSELMYHASGYGALRLVKEHTKDLETYGLESPSAEVSVQFTDGSSFSAAIGNKEPLSGNYYGMVLNDEEEAGNVYIFAEEDVAYFLLKKENYISYQVTPELAVTSPLSAVRDITFSGKALEKTIEIKAVTDSDTETKMDAKSFGPATHIVKMNGTYELDQTYGIEILGSVLGIKAIDVVEYNITDEGLKELGFDDPYMQVDFSLKNNTDYIADYQLRLVPKGDYYMAYMLGSGVVFLIEPPAFVSIDYTKLCMRWFLSPLRTDLTELKVEFDGKTYVYRSGVDDEGNICAWVNDQPMDKDLFFSFYRLITSAASDGLYLEDAVNEGSPVMTITYNYNIEGKSPDVMKLYKGSLRRTNVEINGITEFDMKLSFVDAVKTACEHTLTGENIEENW